MKIIQKDRLAHQIEGTFGATIEAEHLAAAKAELESLIEFIDRDKAEAIQFEQEFRDKFAAFKNKA